MSARPRVIDLPLPADSHVESLDPEWFPDGKTIEEILEALNNVIELPGEDASAEVRLHAQKLMAHYRAIYPTKEHLPDELRFEAPEKFLVIVRLQSAASSAMLVTGRNPRAGEFDHPLRFMYQDLIELAVRLDPEDVNSCLKLETLRLVTAGEIEIPSTRVDSRARKFAENTSESAPEFASRSTEKIDNTLVTAKLTTAGVHRVDLPGASLENRGSFVRGQALIKGLLVQEISGSQFAGEASQMMATIVGQSDTSDFHLGFNQEVGSMMTDAAEEVAEFIRTRHSDRAGNPQIEFAFEEQYIPKDGPSAGVACALLVEAMIEDHAYDTGFTVTGAMNAQGEVGGVGGIDGKIRGAIARDCKIVAVPSENEGSVSDMLTLDG
ncbi:MAG: S16 family serine protease, partial [Verrucomicrobiota bacterium]